MLPRHHDPIVAIATASGRGAVGIVRLSGADLGSFVAAWFGGPLVPRRASLRAFADADGRAIDRGLAIHFPGPESYTGEDVLELQAHGGPVVLQLLLARCLELGARHLPGLRLARPGEFTERAFLNDRLDLAQAEAVGDLIDAGTEAAARSAARSLEGALSGEVAGLARRLVDLRVLVEATLDFPDEEIDFLERADARGRLAKITADLEAVLARTRQGVLLREGLRVVLAGQPNVGKSSLLNALAGAELAIVTPVAGTTRDTVTGTIQIEGVPVHVVDTAGLRDADDAVEKIGVARSWAEIGRADAVVLLRDLTRAGDPEHVAADAAIETELQARLAPGRADRLLRVDNKADAVEEEPAETEAPPDTGLAAGAADANAREVDDRGVDAGGVEAAGTAWRSTGLRDRATGAAGAAIRDASDRLAVSALTGAGLDALRRRLLALAGWQAQPEGVYIARARHVEALRRTARHVAAAAAHAAAGDATLELLAEELRLAHDALGEITGRVSADELLGDIFGRFCIGK